MGWWWWVAGVPGCILGLGLISTGFRPRSNVTEKNQKKYAKARALLGARLDALLLIGASFVMLGPHLRLQATLTPT